MMGERQTIRKIKLKELALSILVAMAIWAVGYGLREVKAYFNVNTESLAAQKNREIEKASLSVGRLEGSTYINEYFGIQCTLDDTWEFENEAGLLKRYNEKFAEGVKDPDYLKSMDDESVNQVVKEYNRVPLMLSYGQDKFVSCYVCFDPQKPGSWSDEEWKQYVEERAAVMEQGLALSDITDVSVEVETIDFAGKTVYCSSSSYKLYGKNCYDRSVLLAQDYFICDITVLSFVSEGDAQTALDCFAAYEPQ